METQTKMVEWLRVIGMAVLVLVLGYLGGLVITLQWNPLYWSPLMRGLILLYWLVVLANLGKVKQKIN